MDSRNFLVIDEHGIDRNASIICSFDVSGSDYLLYTIERDNDNDNIFVSKLVRNLDKTSNLMNIEDAFEKESVSNLVKEMIKYSIDNSSNKLDNKLIMLSNNKNVLLTEVIINKEQNINVKKTYITTVRKSVSNVATNFYNVKIEEKNDNEVFLENVDNDVFPLKENDLENNNVHDELLIDENSNVDKIQDYEEKTNTDNIVVDELPDLLEIPEEISLEIPSINEISDNNSNVSIPSLNFDEKIIEDTNINTIPNIEEISNDTIEVKDNKVNDLESNEVLLEQNNLSNELTMMPIDSDNINNYNLDDNESVDMTSNLLEEQVIEEQKEDNIEIIDAPVITENKKEDSNLLVFDASKEVNLNNALDELSENSVLPVESIEPVREFGEEVKPLMDINESVQEESLNNKISEEKVLVKKRAGFVNNKFFGVIVITLFISACIFLGYEMFQYFSAVK